MAPKKLLEKYIDNFKAQIDDFKFVSDDTALLRGVAADVKIAIAPEFSCLYHSRDTLPAFMKHTLNRGTFFVDGFLQPGNRFFVVLLAFLIATPLGIAALIVWPLYVLAACGVIWIGGLAIALLLGVPAASAASLWLLGPLFALLYGMGIWRGVIMLLRQRLQKRSTI